MKSPEALPEWLLLSMQEQAACRRLKTTLSSKVSPTRHLTCVHSAKVRGHLKAAGGAGLDWAQIRSQAAPACAEKRAPEAEAEDGDFDWELSSLAASLPLKYDYK